MTGPWYLIFKGSQVISSCKSVEQVDVAARYCKLVLRRLKDNSNQSITAKVVKLFRQELDLRKVIIRDQCHFIQEGIVIDNYRGHNAGRA